MTSQGISAIPVSTEPLQKISPGPLETADSLTSKARWTLIILLIVFPPYAWYLMAKYRMYHGWIANVILFNGVFPLLVSVLVAVFYLPTLLDLQQSLGVESYNYWGFTSGIVISVVLIVLGMYFKMKVKKQRELTRKQVVAGIMTIIGSYILTYVSFVISMMSIIYPIYTLTATIN